MGVSSTTGSPNGSILGADPEILAAWIRGGFPGRRRQWGFGIEAHSRRRPGSLGGGAQNQKLTTFEDLSANNSFWGHI